MSKGRYIEDEAAYDAAVKRNIRRNARTGRRQRYFAEDPTREALIEQLRDAAVAGPRGNSFLMKMVDNFDDWGSLTPGQERAVRNALASADARKAAYTAQHKAEAAISTHVGEVGKRGDFSVHVEVSNKQIGESAFGPVFLTKFKDPLGNVLVYRGGKLPVESGTDVVIKATVKDHGEYNGLKQTALSRIVVKEGAALPVDNADD